MKRFPHILIFLSVAIVGCTDLSKVEKEEKENPLEPIVEAAEPAPKFVRYPFRRVINDLTGRSIEAKVLAKSESKIGFERMTGTQKFVVSLDRLSEEDQIFFNGIIDGGNIQAIEEAIAKAARLGNREASWNRDIVSAKREGEKLDLPVLVLFLITGDEKSESIEKSLMFSKDFRKWAGQHLVLCAIPVEPPGSKMAITSEMAKNRKVAEDYGVRSEVTATLDFPRKASFDRISLVGVESAEDMIEEVEGLLDDSSR